jgi:hypothetical protein
LTEPTLLAQVLTRLSRQKSPLVSHREIVSFPAGELRDLLSDGILCESASATEIPRPPHAGHGGDLIVTHTSRGIFAVAEGDDFLEPIRLSEDDIRQYEISTEALIARLRRENSLSVAEPARSGPVRVVGTKRVPGFGSAEVHLLAEPVSLPELEAALRGLPRATSCDLGVVLTCEPIPVPPTLAAWLDTERLLLEPLGEAAAPASLALDWERVVGRLAFVAGGRHPRERRALQWDGATWTLVYEGEARTVPDSLGMAYLARLLIWAGTEIHCTELRDAVQGDGQRRVHSQRVKQLSEQDLAKRKEQLRENRAELERARKNHDIAEIERLAETEYLLLREIAAATGLGGRLREESIDVKRARQSVATALDRALKAIERSHPPAGSHFRNSVEVGEFLHYRSDSADPWFVRFP